MAVGSTSARPIAELWNGSGWTGQVPPVLAGLRSSALQSVSCPSATACFAVGGAVPQTLGPEVALIEAWNGTQWRVLPAAQPPGTPYALGAISCPTSTICATTGFSVPPYGRSEAPLIEVWNGSAWAIGSPPPVAGSFNEEIACPAVTTCTAFYGAAPAVYR
jgi:hypothetical protein